MRTVASKIGYADVQARYIAAGWTPLPLPRRSKFPPPDGYTGVARANPTPRILKHWSRTYPDGNTGLVMPDGVAGIDVDAYRGGDGTFRQLVKRYGAIPETVFSTSRHAETGTYRSGIYLYRVPPGTVLVGSLSGGIEIIQPRHRYAVVWPSLHPEGRMYRWYDSGGTAGIPGVGDLPEMPGAWLRDLAKRSADHEGIPFAGDVDDWMNQLPGGHLHRSYRMWIKEARRRLSHEGGRYDAMVTTVASLVSHGASGQPVREAIEEMFTAYVAAVGGERDAESEFYRALEGAISKFGGM